MKNIFLRLMAFGFLVFGISLGDNLYAGPSLVGTWSSKPTLSELGYIKTTYTFNADGTFSKKNDFISFCEKGAVKPGCVYFWHIVEGSYTTSGSSLVLKVVAGRSEQMREGEKKPIIRDLTPHPLPVYEYSLVLKPEKIILTDKKYGDPQIFTRTANKKGVGNN